MSPMDHHRHRGRDRESRPESKTNKALVSEKMRFRTSVGSLTHSSARPLEDSYRVDIVRKLVVLGVTANVIVVDFRFGRHGS